jgi:DNA-binding MltR family transcriptional regulator
MKIVNALALFPVVLFVSALGAQAPSNGAPPDQAVPAPAKSFDEAVDRAIQRERTLIALLVHKAPVVETYIQEIKPDSDLGFVPNHDHYFLGKLDISKGIGDDSFIPVPSGFKSVPFHMKNAVTRQYFPRGFAQMIFMDESEFNRAHYRFSYVRREFLGEVRCIVMDVIPTDLKGHDRFVGRMWVEDEGYNVVRFNGVYTPTRDHHHSHFDSWRVNAGPDLWLPAYVYTQEVGHGIGILKDPPFRAQTRLWDYETQGARSQEAFTNMTVDVPGGAKDSSDAGAQDTSPVEAERQFQKQAENNILERLQRAGLMAPDGEVDQVLDTVVNNLIVTNNLVVDSPVHVRTLLTTPLESISVGHTIVLSRGLIDVLPDEACLAAVLAHELAHISLNHTVDTAYAFTDRLLFEDPDVIKHLNIARTAAEEEAADKKAQEILKNSPYKDKLGRVGLFLRQLSARSDEVPHLIKPLLGNRMAGNKDLRLGGLMEMSPELQVRNPEQVAALPLGSRVRMNPWNDQLYMMKSHNVALMSAKEKLPFEITPFILHLTREPNSTPAPNGSAPTSANENSQPGPAGNGPVNTSENTQPVAAPKQQPF